MDMAKSSLVGLLLENGEDDLAAVLAGSGLPDVLDTDRDGETLCAMGIPVDELVVPSAFDGTTGYREDRGDTEWVRQTEAVLSRRCAELVDIWTGHRRG